MTRLEEVALMFISDLFLLEDFLGQTALYKLGFHGYDLGCNQGKTLV